MLVYFQRLTKRVKNIFHKSINIFYKLKLCTYINLPIYRLGDDYFLLENGLYKVRKNLMRKSRGKP